MLCSKQTGEVVLKDVKFKIFHCSVKYKDL